MLQFFPATDKEPSKIVQRMERPVVYFDHWAHARFSRDQELGERFVKILHERKGTFALSILNLSEFSGLTDLDQAKAAERFLESLLPRVFFVRFSPTEVRDGEIARWTGKTTENPAGDVSLLHLFGLPMAEGRGPLHARGLFSEAVRQRVQVQALLTSLIQRVQADYEQYLVASRRPPLELKRMIKRQLRALVGLPRPTEALRLAIIEGQFSDAHPAIKSHDAVDILHTIVPVAYCQYVLLDGKWCGMVERARKRLTAAGISGLAKVYSERENGLERFLEDLSAASFEPPKPGLNF